MQIVVMEQTMTLVLSIQDLLLVGFLRSSLTSAERAVRSVSMPAERHYSGPTTRESCQP